MNNNSSIAKSMKYIVKDPLILGGAPTIVGTRIPAERLAHLVKQGYQEDNIRKEFPGVKISTIRSALAELMFLSLSSL